jgi:predicted GH43/DUF377 family glycosyl hydrolase
LTIEFPTQQLPLNAQELNDAFAASFAGAGFCCLWTGIQGKRPPMNPDHSGTQSAAAEPSPGRSGARDGASHDRPPKFRAEWRSLLGSFLIVAGLLGSSKAEAAGAAADVQTAGGWRKLESNPVLGGKLGTCFDVSVLKEGETFRMWFSWRPKASVALVESQDGVRWGDPVIVLSPNKKTGWEQDINRPVVLRRADGYHMWYTGEAKGRAAIGYATSLDGRNWERRSERPVVAPEQSWENVAVMCPHVLWDDSNQLYRMWYSGGEQYEPNAIGYATSPDGLVWHKHAANPIFGPDPQRDWERERVTACQVVPQGAWYLMFYIGFRDVDHAQIGLARSRDGITHWERLSANPIIRPGRGAWDSDAVYKPYAIWDGSRWLLWYNGRRGGSEQIGLALHEGSDLGF